ncbi:MAG: type II toxin-antitoxin system Phd/YefM family antitoxin [Candidatus Aminicenantaceae bacterium]
MQPISIGIREAKINLSKLLKNVQKGGEIIITDRGKPVGKIVPVTQDSLSLAARIKKLEGQGWIEPQKTENQSPLPAPLPLPGEIAQKYLREDRNS